MALHGVAMLNRFQATMTGFEPATEGQRRCTRRRFGPTTSWSKPAACGSMRPNTGLPGVIWFVVLAGAAIGLTATFFFKVEDVDCTPAGPLLAAFIGLVIFMILAFDRRSAATWAWSRHPMSRSTTW